MATKADGFDPIHCYVHLEDGAAVRPIPVAEDFWETIAERRDLDGGRLLCMFRFEADWPHWECHPAGDEVVLLVSGAVDLVLDEPAGERVVALRDRAFAVVPRGIWHRAIVHARSDVLTLTRGEGTDHRPL